MNKVIFEELPLSLELKRAISDMGFTEATPIQAAAIPALLTGIDIVGQAQTGTGKTATFGIPTVEKIDASNKVVQAIILCPTRELAMQVADELKKLIKYKDNLFTLTVYGGTSIEPQMKNLKKGVQIVVGTPGRVIDLIKRKSLDLSAVETVVLDEADEMLNMGFREDMEFILSHTPKHRQTVLFSATMPPAILDIAKTYMNKPEIVKIASKELTVTNIEQTYYEIKEKDKVNLMTRLIDYHDLQLMLVFCNTKRTVDALNDFLQQKGHKSEGLHGDLSQNQRDMVMRKFRKGQINLLIATDVAARGIDVDNVDAVFNFDIPLDQEAYVHRIGRTGRAGRVGKAFNFVSGKRDWFNLKDIQRYTKSTIQEGFIPQAEDLIEVNQQKALSALHEIIKDADLSGFEDLTEQILALNTPQDKTIAALLYMAIGENQNYVDLEPFNSSSSKGRERGGKDRDRKTENRGRDRDRDRKRERGGKKKKDSNMTRLFINIGKKQKVSPSDILGAILGETGLKSNQVGEIDIYDKFTFVDVDTKAAAKVIKVMKKNKVKGKPINVEVAQD